MRQEERMRNLGRIEKSFYTPQLNKEPKLFKYQQEYESEEDREHFLKPEEIFDINQTRLKDLTRVQNLADNEETRDLVDQYLKRERTL